VTTLSIILPAKNEAVAVGATVASIFQYYPGAEVIVVNDGSTDSTAAVAEEAGARVVHHPYSKGNGAAIKSGARAASGEVIVFMDADGQHRPEDIALLLEKLNEGAGYDMVVGARDNAGQANIHRSFANGFYNKFASWMVGHKYMI
jgi:glycosyltransferase involved in cell wall biosynthesis